MKKDQWALLIAFFCTCIAIFNFEKWEDGKVITSDKKIYYAYLPATFIYNDITLQNPSPQFQKVAHNFYLDRTNDGDIVHKTTMGVAIAYLPFFSIADIHCKLFNYPLDGFSTPYQFWIAISALCYWVLGFIFLRKLLRKYFSESTVALTILAIALATNLYLYSTLVASMSHSFSFGLIALLVFLVDKWYRTNKLKDAVFIGLLFGWIILIRPTNIFLIFIMVFWEMDFLNILSHPFLQKKYWLHLLMTFIMSVIVWIPQLIYWKMATGDFLVFSYGEEGFFFSDPKIIEILFSFRNGWLIYSPICVFSLIGMIFLLKRDKSIGISVLLCIGTMLYIYSCWWVWWFGGAFGYRSMIDLYPILSIPLAAFFSFLISKLKVTGTVISITLVVVFSYINMFQTFQVNNGFIHYDSMTYKAYKYVFLKHPRNLDMGAYWDRLKQPDYKACLKGDRDFDWSETK